MELKAYHFIFLTLLALTIARLYRFSKLARRSDGFPPGPEPLPLIGNLHHIPLSRPELQFAEYAQKYGSMTGLKLGKQNMVVLNTWQAVYDLIEQKGALYASRAKHPVVEIIVPDGLNPALNRYGELWRKQRKAIVDFLGGEKTDRMKPVQDAESTQMIYEIMRTPERFQEFVFRSFGAVILATVFGQRGKTYEPGGKIERFFTYEEEFGEAVSPTSSPPLNSFPFLRYLPDWLTPWKGWQDRARRVMDNQQWLYIGLVKEARQRMQQGKGLNSFIAQKLQTQEKEWYSDKQLAYMGGVLFEGGAETSASSTLVFILAMAAYPDVCKKAQEEVDAVCGKDRLPGKDDTNRLPYIRACVMEVGRWRPILPLALPHTVMSTDTYQGYTIPAETDVLINTWNIHHDAAEYADPDTFNPSRFLANKYGIKSPPATDPATDPNKGRRPTYSFGAGRRVCPGQRFAENTMIMHFAKLAWAFDFQAQGTLPLDTRGWSEGVITKPKGLDVRMTLRDGFREAVIERAWRDADAFLAQFENGRSG